MPSSFLPDFLRVRSLDRVTGRPLYTYRCSDEERAAAESVLREHLPNSVRQRRIGPLTSQLFCLWAAEWWCANHAGGPWRWEDLLAALGVQELGPYGGGYLLLQETVEQGLRAWGRPLLYSSHGRGFLATLACEGGLPLRVLAREQAGLRHYFRALLEEFRVYSAAGVPEHELAARVGGLLPRTLRQDVVYELSGRLIGQIHELQTEVGESNAPVAHLDRVRPGWRDELPLRVTDDVATTLINGLLLDARSIARGGATQVRFIRWIERGAEGWTLSGELRLPTSLEGAEVAALFALDTETPTPARFELARRADGAGAAPVALGTERKDSGQSRIILERLPGRNGEVSGDAAARGQALLLRSGTLSVESRAFRGAAPLSDLPWVWAPQAGSCRYEWAGQGSTNVSTDHAIAVVPDGVQAEAGAGGATCEHVGRLEALRRQAYRVRGTARFRDSDGSYEVRTGADSSAAGVEYSLQGRRREVGREGTPVFIGVPHLLARREDAQVPRKVPSGGLAWRADRLPEAPWVPLSEGCVGDGRIRYTEDGVVRHIVRTKILPAGAKIRFHPDQARPAGDIELIGFGADAIRLLGPAGLEAKHVRTLDADRLSLFAVPPLPQAVEVELEWHGRGRLHLCLPFPGLGAVFQTARGEILPHGATLPLGQLSGARAAALVPQHGAEFFVVGSFLGKDPEALGGVPRTFRIGMDALDAGHFELDLGRVEQEVYRRLGRSSDPDAVVRLVVSSNDISNLPQPLIQVGAFDLKFEAEGEPGVLYVATASYPGLPESEAAMLRVEAVPLADPERAPVALAHDRDRRWRVPLESMEAGPWLVLGWLGDWSRVRPFVYGAHPAEIPSTPGRLASAFRMTSADLQSVVHALAADASHPDWPAVYALARRARAMPAAAFAPLVALSHCPEAAALAALRAAPEDLAALWAALHSLPFSWRQIPRSAWRHAVARFLDGARAEIENFPISMIPDQNAWLEAYADAAARRVGAELNSLEPLLLIETAIRLSRPLAGRVAPLHVPPFRADLLAAYRKEVSNAPALAPGVLPPVSGMPLLLARLIALPAGSELLVRAGGGSEQTQALRLAPAVLALAALTDTPLSPAQHAQLRAISDLVPDWFANVYDLAALYLLGASHAAQLASGVGSGPKPVLPLPR